MGKKDGHILAVDSLRGISAITIACVYHLNTVAFPYTTGLPFERTVLFNWCYRRGSLLVTMFLVISGYTSFAVYTQKIDNGLSFRQYAIRRMIRIFPLMLVTLLLASMGDILWFWQHNHTWWTGGNDNNTVASFILSCFGIQTPYLELQSWNYPSWSLGVFFSCWGIFWLVIRLTRKRPQIRLAICFALILYGLKQTIPIPLFLSTGINVGFFAGGGYILPAKEDRKREEKNDSFYCRNPSLADGSSYSGYTNREL